MMRKKIFGVPYALHSGIALLFVFILKRCRAPRRSWKNVFNGPRKVAAFLSVKVLEAWAWWLVMQYLSVICFNGNVCLNVLLLHIPLFSDIVGCQCTTRCAIKTVPY